MIGMLYAALYIIPSSIDNQSAYVYCRKNCNHPLVFTLSSDMWNFIMCKWMAKQGFPDRKAPDNTQSRQL